MWEVSQRKLEKEDKVKTKYLIALSAIMLVAVMGCGLLDTVVNQAVSGGKPAGTVSDLWSDVPKMDGMNKTNMNLPVAAQLAIKAMTQGNFDFIAYTTTKTPQDVQNFYSADRMSAAGWDSQNSGGCTDMSGSTGSSAAGICFFEKTNVTPNVALAIVIAQDDQTKQTQLFFVRVTDTGTPSQ